VNSLWQIGVMALVAVAGFGYWLRHFGRYALKHEVLALLLSVGMLLAIAGGHLAYMVAHRVSGQAACYFLFTLPGWRYGYLSIGLLLGYALTVFIAARAFRYPFRYLADLTAPTVFSTAVIWRLNCFFHGCCYGVTTSLPWGVSFPDAGELLLRTPPVHPTQLYELVLCMTLFTLTPLAMHWLVTRPGEGLLSLACLGAYAMVRLFVDHFRVGASMEPLVAGLSASQLLAGGIALLCVVAMAVVIRKRIRSVPSL